MKTDFITIRENQSLINLAARCKDSIENVTDFILKKLVHHELVADIPEECGLKLSEILYENGITITGFTLKVFGKCFGEVLLCMEGLEIWNLENDCTECGGEMEYPGLYNSDYSKCTNCGYERFENDYDADQYRDDCFCNDKVIINELNKHDLN